MGDGSAKNDLNLNWFIFYYESTLSKLLYKYTLIALLQTIQFMFKSTYKFKDKHKVQLFEVCPISLFELVTKQTQCKTV